MDAPYYVGLINAVAQSYEGRNLDELSRREQDIWATLVTHGHIVQEVPSRGAVGKAVIMTNIPQR